MTIDTTVEPQLRVVPPGEPLEALDEWYPWPAGRAWLRCMMLGSLDGAVRGDDGLSGSLSSPADQEVFRHARRFAHAVLVGAETLRAERYEPIVADPADAEERARRGLPPAPVLAVVSASLRLDWSDPVFRQSTMRPVVITTEAASIDARTAAERWCDVLVLPGLWVEAHQLVSALSYRGLLHVVCEGGPHLLAELSRAHLVHEADITIAPVQAGGGQVATGPAMPDPHAFALASVIVQDGWLFTRYIARTALLGDIAGELPITPLEET